MDTARVSAAKAVILSAVGLTVAAMGVYVAGADEAPGAGRAGMLLMAVGAVLGARAARGRLPTWALRTAMAVGVVAAAFAAFLIHQAVVTAPLFPQAQGVPSVVDPAPPPRYADAVRRARQLVQAAIARQNLPGVSVAVGAGGPVGTVGAIIWAEGFGWRDVASRAPVMPDTRFNIGTAASPIAAILAPLGLIHTGADPVADWSPGHIGEPEDDFPPFTLIRHAVFRPLGLAPDQPLPGNRATAYVPVTDDDPALGRREMYMRDMVCCANRTAFYSTPSDLVRLALATNPGSVEGQLAGGTVMSLMTGRDSAIAVAVTSNVAHADTAALARRIGEAFSEPGR